VKTVLPSPVYDGKYERIFGVVEVGIAAFGSDSQKRARFAGDAPRDHSDCMAVSSGLWIGEWVVSLEYLCYQSLQIAGGTNPLGVDIFSVNFIQ